MEAISFGFAIVAEARHLASSMKNRITNYRDGPATFRTLSDNVDCLAKHIMQVENILREFLIVVPNDICGIFNTTFFRVLSILKDSDAIMEHSFSKPFGSGSSNVMDWLQSKALRKFRASSLRKKVDDVEAMIKDASHQLLELTVVLGNALKIQENQEAVLPELYNLAVIDMTQDDALDAEGKPANPEGLLKQYVLLSDSSSTVTAAVGVVESDESIVGTPRVGKTVALQGLPYDKDIRKRFPDGVFFMTLGRGATVQTVLHELTNILTITGATTIVAAVRNCTVLRDAVSSAASWFARRSCLFLVDDIWPTAICETGFLEDLRYLLRDSPDSRIVISTRSITIAHSAGAVVKFGVLDPEGTASMKIFMAHAAGDVPGGTYAELGSKARSSVLKILSICDGLPIALAITGSAVAFMSSSHGDIESALVSYATRLEKRISLLGEGTSLSAHILLSLEYLEIEFMSKAKRSHLMSYCIRDLYTSLCVIENQGWVSVSVLGRLWRLDKDTAMETMNLFCEMSMAKLRMGRPSNEYSTEAGILLHPLQLEFCSRTGSVSNAQDAGSWLPCFRRISSSSGGSEGDFFSSKRLTTSINVPSCTAVVPTSGHERIIYSVRNALHVFDLILNENELGFVSDYESDSTSSCYESSSCGSLGLSKFPSCKSSLTTLNYARNAKRIVSGSGDGKVQLWNTESKRLFGEAPTGHAEHLLSVAINSSGKIVIAGSLEGTLHMWKFEGNKPTQTSVFKCPHEIRSVCITGNGRRAMSSAGDTISVWSTKKRKERYTLRGDSHEIFCLDVTENGKYLVSGSRNGAVRLWNLEEKKGQCIFTFSVLVSGVSISNDGLRLAASSTDGTTRIFNLSSRSQIGAPIRHPAGDRPSVALNDNGTRLIVSTGENIASWAIADNNDPVDQIEEEITTLNIT